MRSRLLVVLLGSTACVADGDGQGDTDGSLIPAVGIRIDHVEANQGVGVVIGSATGAVPPEARTGYLVAQRRTLFRGYWALDADFVSRPIEAHLRLVQADGREETFVSQALVEGPPAAAHLEATFSWGITEPYLDVGVNYDIRLFEVDAGPSGARPIPNVYPPDTTPLIVGIESAPTRMHTVLVPIDYDDGAGCQTLPDTSPATLDLFRDLAHMNYPVQELRLDLHAPMTYHQPLEAFTDINTQLTALRVAENAPPEVLYYGLVDLCQDSLNGVLGEAFLASTPPIREQGPIRVSSGIWDADRPEISAETFVHELGHSLGRLHVACDGSERGIDLTYPVEGGAIGSWGFGILDFQLRHPTVFHDFMTYCHPAWVSTFGWNKAFPVLRDFTAWETASAIDPSERTGAKFLLGAVLPSGRETWTVVPGGIAALPAVARPQFEFLAPEGATTMVEGVELKLSEEGSAGRAFAIPLPDTDLRRLSQIRRLEGPIRRVLAEGAIQAIRTTLDPP